MVLNHIKLILAKSGLIQNFWINCNVFCSVFEQVFWTLWDIYWLWVQLLLVYCKWILIVGELWCINYVFMPWFVDSLCDASDKINFLEPAYSCNASETYFCMHLHEVRSSLLVIKQNWILEWFSAKTQLWLNFVTNDLDCVGIIRANLIIAI